MDICTSYAANLNPVVCFFTVNVTRLSESGFDQFTLWYFKWGFAVVPRENVCIFQQSRCPRVECRVPVVAVSMPAVDGPRRECFDEWRLVVAHSFCSYQSPLTGSCSFLIGVASGDHLAMERRPHKDVGSST